MLTNKHLFRSLFPFARQLGAVMALPPLFGRVNQPAGPSIEDLKQQAFVKLKAVCVPILNSSRLPPSTSSTRTLLDLLKKLQKDVASIPSAVFSSALANYVFFPLSSLLQPAVDGRNRSETVLEGTMGALEALVIKWKSSPGGIDARVLQELWILASLRLGGPLDPAGPNGKGKAKEVNLSEETKYAILKLLVTIMKPVEAREKDDEEADDPLGENIDWTADDPFSSGSKKVPTSSSEEVPVPLLPPIPILFHTLTTLTALAEVPSSHTQLQLTSLDALRILFQFFLSQHPPSKSPAPSPLSTSPPPTGPSPFVATALPGTASALSRVALSVPRSTTDSTAQQARRQPSAAIIASLALLGVVLRLAVGDNLTAELRRKDATDATIGTLEELSEEVEVANSSNGDLPEATSSTRDVFKTSSTTDSTGPALPTPAWLSHTLANLTTLFVGLSGLSSHESPQVRLALVAFLDDVLRQCGGTLGESKGVLLESLLLLSGDEWDTVKSPAQEALAKLLEERDTSNAQLAANTIKRRLTGLPAVLQRSEEAKVCSSARIVVAGLRVLSTKPPTSRVLSAIDRWSWSLLRALDFERVGGADSSLRPGMAQAWITSDDYEEGGDAHAPWPYLSMKHLKEKATKKELEYLWRSLGSWAVTNKQGSELIDEFLSVATGARGGEGVAVSALWVLDGTLSGFQDSAETKGTKKIVRGVVRSVLELLESLENDSPQKSEAPTETETPTTDQSLADSQQSLDITVEHQRGVSLTPGLDSLKPVATTNVDAQKSQRILLSCFCLRLLATSASLLTSSFQPHLLQSLYHVLSYLSPISHPLLRLHAQLALSRIAYWTSYASPQNLVLANVDYVVNSVSQRLSISHLNPAAPLVLVEMIRLVGEPILPMVQDLVEDVFEALDDYHGYEDLTIGLWGVLDALMKVMARSAESEADCGNVNPVAQGATPDSESEWTAFARWYSSRNDPLESDGEEDEEDGPSSNPQKPFESNLGHDKGTEFPSDQALPATRTQMVGAQILSKALYFLSHSSPFLRSRVLSLISAAVPLFTASSPPASDQKVPNNRQSDLLPVVHRAWPYILNRFSDPELYVVLEAAGLVESLAIHAGEFMSRRILEDVWPRFKSLLEKQEKQDQLSAIAGQSQYTVSHRIYRSILVAMMHVARHVALKETVLWEQAVIFRRFLDTRLDSELQKAAKGVYVELGKVNSDIIWLVLAGALETVADDELPLFLRIPKVDIEENVNLVLSSLDR